MFPWWLFKYMVKSLKWGCRESLVSCQDWPHGVHLQKEQRLVTVRKVNVTSSQTPAPHFWPGSRSSVPHAFKEPFYFGHLCCPVRTHSGDCDSALKGRRPPSEPVAPVQDWLRRWLLVLGRAQLSALQVLSPIVFPLFKANHVPLSFIITSSDDPEQPTYSRRASQQAIFFGNFIWCFNFKETQCRQSQPWRWYFKWPSLGFLCDKARKGMTPRSLQSSGELEVSPGSCQNNQPLLQEMRGSANPVEIYLLPIWRLLK